MKSEKPISFEPFFDVDEERAMELLREFVRVVKEHWRLGTNYDELVSAIHTLQLFVIVHAGNRVHPADFANWYEDASVEESPEQERTDQRSQADDS